MPMTFPSPHVDKRRYLSTPPVVYGCTLRNYYSTITPVSYKSFSFMYVFQIGDQFKIHSFLNKFHIMVPLRWTQCMYTLNCSKPSKSKSLFYLPQILDFMVIVKLMIQDRLFGESGRTSRKILFHTFGLFSSPIFDFPTFSKCLVKSNFIVFDFSFTHTILLS